MKIQKIIKIRRGFDAGQRGWPGDAKVKRSRIVEYFGNETVLSMSTRGPVTGSSKYASLRMRPYVYRTRMSKTKVRVTRLLM